MADVALFLAGAALCLVVLIDLVATTVSLSSVAGPLSGRFAALVWGLASRANRRPITIVKRSAGPLLIVVTLAGWLGALTLGWTLIFTVDGALESTTSNATQVSHVRFVDALFYVFGSLVGRGSSGLAPHSVWWSSVQMLMALSGVALLTLSLAWILPIVSAVVQKRSIAAQLSALGRTPVDVIRNGWNGRDFGDLHLYLVPLVSGLSMLAQRHLAYPLMHYFHSADARTAIGPRVAVLDEALTLIEAAGFDDPDRGLGLGTSATVPLRQAIDDYLATLEKVFICRADHAPRLPEVTGLGTIGDTDEEEAARELERLCERLEGRRSLLLGYLHHDGWAWDRVMAGSDS